MQHSRLTLPLLSYRLGVTAPEEAAEIGPGRRAQPRDTERIRLAARPASRVRSIRCILDERGTHADVDRSGHGTRARGVRDDKKEERFDAFQLIGRWGPKTGEEFVPEFTKIGEAMALTKLTDNELESKGNEGKLDTLKRVNHKPDK